jgi:hypothetical protein
MFGPIISTTVGPGPSRQPGRQILPVTNPTHDFVLSEYQDEEGQLFVLRLRRPESNEDSPRFCGPGTNRPAAAVIRSTHSALA